MFKTVHKLNFFEKIKRKFKVKLRCFCNSTMGTGTSAILSPALWLLRVNSVSNCPRVITQASRIGLRSGRYNNFCPCVSVATRPKINCRITSRKNMGRIRRRGEGRYILFLNSQRLKSIKNKKTRFELLSN